MKLNVNNRELKIQLNRFSERLKPAPMLKIIGDYMVDSIATTFDEQGSPAGSWAPLAPATLRRRRSRRKAQKILIDKGKLRDISYVVAGRSVLIGPNEFYGRIHQLGGHAGRRGPKNPGKPRKTIGAFRRPYIPARPFLVLRPEDPAEIEQRLTDYILDAFNREGGSQ